MLNHEHAFPSSKRLLKPVEFRHAFGTGIRIRCSAFTIDATLNNFEHPRLGLAISRRAVARAVDRNRIKRVVRESFRSNASAIGSLDIVVRAAPTARIQSNALLSRKLNDLWRKIKNNTQNIRT